MLKMLIDNNFATIEEVQTALAALSKADLLRLGKLARYHIRGIPTIEPHDLLNEAIVSLLQGGKKGETRQWPKSTNFLTFLANVMKSIASSHRRQHGRLIGKNTPWEEVEDSLSEESHENAIIKFFEIEQELALIRSLFKDDKEAISILELIFDDTKKIEIMKKTGLTEKRYDAARKRIRRKTEHLNINRRI